MAPAQSENACEEPGKRIFPSDERKPVEAFRVKSFLHVCLPVSVISVGAQRYSIVREFAGN